MSEREIRRLLGEVCAELDARVWGAARRALIPAAFGATLALTGCESEALYGVPMDTVDASDATDPDVAPLYAAPDDVSDSAAPGDADGGPQILYGVP